MRTMIIAAGLFMMTAPAFAECECRCVNGSVQALCENAMDMKPICPLQLCAMTPLSIPPLQPLGIPPLGTTRCEQRQVMNPYTNQYQWQSVCD